MTDPTIKRGARVWLTIGYVVLGLLAIGLLALVAAALQSALAN